MESDVNLNYFRVKRKVETVTKLEGKKWLNEE